MAISLENRSTEVGIVAVFDGDCNEKNGAPLAIEIEGG